MIVTRTDWPMLLNFTVDNRILFFIINVVVILKMSASANTSLDKVFDKAQFKFLQKRHWSKDLTYEEVTRFLKEDLSPMLKEYEYEGKAGLNVKKYLEDEAKSFYTSISSI